MAKWASTFNKTIPSTQSEMDQHGVDSMKTKHPRNQSWWSNPYNVGMLLVALLILLLIAAAFQYCFETDLETTTWFSIPIWTVVYFKIFFKKSWKKVPANMGMIMFTAFKPLQSPRDNEAAKAATSNYTVLHNQRGLGSGWQGISWFEQQSGELIPIVKSAPINFIVYAFDKNNAPWEVPVTFSMSPLEGRFLPRTRVSNFDTASQAFQKIIGRKIGSLIRERDKGQILADAEKITNEASDSLDGPDHYHDSEIEHGYYTGKVEVGIVQPNAKVRDALEAAVVSELQVEGVRKLQGVLETEGGKDAMDAFLALNGGAKVIIIRGLEGAQGNIHIAGEVIGEAIEAAGGKKKK